MILDFDTDEAVCRERIRQRIQDQADASEATEDVLDRQLQVREPLSNDEQRLAVRFGAALPQTIEMIIERFRRASGT